jgi:UDP-N-acetylglucosamine--N-acetylmuramyl-(pentapeptide) pyrophosphoryl-undecaprenol N-acetylglucosamine transferase
MKINKVVISGGGTGGHIFPAIAIADEIKHRNPEVEILFIGAVGKMEMEKVPKAGYKIIGLPIAGFQRQFSFSNFVLPFKILQSLIKAKNILKEFEPQVVIGVGGYASGPTLKAATSLKIPTLIQEQNSFPGKTNKILANRVNRICTAYEGLEKFFPKEKLVLTGNPVRAGVVEHLTQKREEAIAFFNLDKNKPTILVIGGSLGAKTLNESVLHAIPLIEKKNVQVLWQSGKSSFQSMKAEMNRLQPTQVYLHEFIFEMDLAYAAAEIIVSRAGAIAVSELCLVNKPVILVPSPNVAEDHQTKNAMALVNKNAAVLVRDVDAKTSLFDTAFVLLNDNQKQKKLSEAIATLGISNATKMIVDEVEKIIASKS